MNAERIAEILSDVPTPCYALDEAAFRENIETISAVAGESGARVLLALKAFSSFCLADLFRGRVEGTAASSPDEARLGREEFGGAVHIFSPAYRESDFADILSLADCVVFNSPEQWRRFRPLVTGSGREIKCGMRLNPEHSEVKTPIYDPCAPRSRLGTTLDNLAGADLEGISGFHFHTLCEKNSDALERTLRAVEERFGKWLRKAEWVNFGGGHHITRADYDRGLLCRLVREFRDRYGTEVYLEPGEAFALEAGYLVTEVLDLVDNRGPVAILDASAAAHMPDILEMPYRPGILGAGRAGEFRHDYRLAGPSCLAGDVIGDYSFPRPLKPGSRLVFTDMAHYTIVKNNTFNGLRLPAIVVFDSRSGRWRTTRKFSYRDFRDRLS